MMCVLYMNFYQFQPAFEATVDDLGVIALDDVQIDTGDCPPPGEYFETK